MGKLDIIVTHYKEPWETGQKFFSMLDMQRGIRFDDFRVLLVNDGEENALPDELFTGRPYEVQQISIPQSGVSVARNKGIEEAGAEWLMFCDFDDTFANVYALMDILDVLPAENVDLLWADLYVEERRGDTVKLAEQGINGVFNHGKVYRRSFLIDNGIWFDAAFPYCEDSLFNTICYTVCPPERIAHIRTPRPVYIWCDTEGSVSNQLKNRESGRMYVYMRNKKVCECYKDFRPFDQYCAMVARTIIDTYYTLNVPNVPEQLRWMIADFREWYAAHKRYYQAVPYETLKLVKEKSRKCCYPECVGTREEISVTKWLEQIERGVE